jgi:hypothetical protein
MGGFSFLSIFFLITDVCIRSLIINEREWWPNFAFRSCRLWCMSAILLMLLLSFSPVPFSQYRSSFSFFSLFLHILVRVIIYIRIFISYYWSHEFFRLFGATLTMLYSFLPSDNYLTLNVSWLFFSEIFISKFVWSRPNIMLEWGGEIYDDLFSLQRSLRHANAYWDKQEDEDRSSSRKHIKLKIINAYKLAR